jgi:galactitol-specific phosphotransferase system IIB component
MNRKIAIEPNLTPIKELLTEKGYNVENIDYGQGTTNNNNYDAFIVAGVETNFMGIQDTNSKAVVINAEGLTAEQVYQELQKELQKKLH